MMTRIEYVGHRFKGPQVKVIRSRQAAIRGDRVLRTTCAGKNDLSSMLETLQKKQAPLGARSIGHPHASFERRHGSFAATSIVAHIGRSHLFYTGRINIVSKWDAKTPIEDSSASINL